MVQQGQPGDILDLIERRHGVAITVRENPELAVIGTTVATLFKQNPRRIRMLVQNIAQSEMYIGFDIGISATTGLTLPAGGLFVASWEDASIMPAKEWFILGAAASLEVYSLEEVIV